LRLPSADQRRRPILARSRPARRARRPPAAQIDRSRVVDETRMARFAAHRRIRGGNDSASTCVLWNSLAGRGAGAGPRTCRAGQAAPARPAVCLHFTGVHRRHPAKLLIAGNVAVTRHNGRSVDKNW